jgi:hypothetical protein
MLNDKIKKNTNYKETRVNQVNSLNLRHELRD